MRGTRNKQVGGAGSNLCGETAPLPLLLPRGHPASFHLGPCPWGKGGSALLEAKPATKWAVGGRSLCSDDTEGPFLLPLSLKSAPATGTSPCLKPFCTSSCFL